MAFNLYGIMITEIKMLSKIKLRVINHTHEVRNFMYGIYYFFRFTTFFKCKYLDHVQYIFHNNDNIPGSVSIIILAMIQKQQYLLMNILQKMRKLKALKIKYRYETKTLGYVNIFLAVTSLLQHLSG